MECVSEANNQGVPEQIRIRAEKRQRLIDDGRNPYPIEVPITHTLSQVREKYPNHTPRPEDVLREFLKRA